MEDGSHTESVNEATEPTSKVVRLPRDWLGPHDELVPFGRRTAPSDPTPTSPESPRATPSAEDFWGGVLQVPSELGSPEPASVAGATRPASRFRLGRQRLAAASIAAVAAAVAIVLLSGGAGHPVSGGARLNLAAILSGGVSRILEAGPPQIVSPTPAAAPRVVRHVAHHPPPSSATHRQSAPPPPPVYAARSVSASPAPTYRSNISEPSRSAGATPSPAGHTASSGGSVSATGQSGALGPVQSPNG